MQHEDVLIQRCGGCDRDFPSNYLHAHYIGQEQTQLCSGCLYAEIEAEEEHEEDR